MMEEGGLGGQRRRLGTRRGWRAAVGLWRLSCALRSSSSIRHMPLTNASRGRLPTPAGSHSLLHATTRLNSFTLDSDEQNVPDIPELRPLQSRRLPHHRNHPSVQSLVRPHLLIDSLYRLHRRGRRAILLGVRDQVHRQPAPPRCLSRLAPRGRRRVRTGPLALREHVPHKHGLVAAACRRRSGRRARELARDGPRLQRLHGPHARDGCSRSRGADDGRAI